MADSSPTIPTATTTTATKRRRLSAEEQLELACQHFRDGTITQEELKFLEESAYYLGYQDIRALCQAYSAPSSPTKKKRLGASQELGVEWAPTSTVRDVSFLLLQGKANDLSPSDVLHFCTANTTVRKVCESQLTHLQYGPAPEQVVTLDIIQRAKLSLLGLRTDDALAFRHDVQRCYLQGLASLNPAWSQEGEQCFGNRLFAIASNPSLGKRYWGGCFQWPQDSTIFYPPEFAANLFVRPIPVGGTRSLNLLETPYLSLTSTKAIAFLAMVQSADPSLEVTAPESVLQSSFAHINLEELLLVVLGPHLKCLALLAQMGLRVSDFLDLKPLAMLIFPQPLEDGSYPPEWDGTLGTTPVALSAIIRPNYAPFYEPSVWKYGIAHDDVFAISTTGPDQGLAVVRVGDGGVWHDSDASRYVPRLLHMVNVEQVPTIAGVMVTTSLPTADGPWMQALLKLFMFVLDENVYALGDVRTALTELWPPEEGTPFLPDESVPEGWERQLGGVVLEGRNWTVDVEPAILVSGKVLAGLVDML